MSISFFKSTCLSVLEKVRRTGTPVMITRRGKPVARILPPRAMHEGTGETFGCMAGTAAEIGDILEPLPASQWEVLR